MSMAVKIIRIRKNDGYHENPYVAISSMDWINEATLSAGSNSREQLYDFIQEGDVAYVKDEFGNQTTLITDISVSGTKYVKTVADQLELDSLLKLPECRYPSLPLS